MPLAAPARPLVGLVERLDPALDELIAPDARPAVLSEGYKWSEGPVWTAGALLFSDVPNNVVWRWSETAGVTQFLRPSGYTGTVPRGGEPGSNGLAVDTPGACTCASTATAGSRASRPTVTRSRRSPTNTTASASTARTIWW